jgi:hypothetical protein
MEQATHDTTGTKFAKDSAAHAMPDTAAAPGSVMKSTMAVTETGYGPLRIGMTVANAATALGSPIPSMAGLDTACAYVRIANAPPGLRVLAVRDTVARIEIDSTNIATGLGARVGDPEWRVRDLYGSRVTVQPHKYLPNGHYMIVSPIPATDSGFRLVFETDGTKITKYRAGREPEVEWVEGCA